MISLAVGFVILSLSVWAGYRYFADVLSVLRGLLPVLFLFGGLFTIMAGISGIRDDIIEKNKSQETK